MILNLAAGALALMAAILFLGGVIVLALGAHAWMNAVASAHRARSHGSEADANARITAEGLEALEAAKPTPFVPVAPTSREIEDQIRFERRSARAEMDEFTTLGNEGLEEVPPVGDGTAFYRPAPEEPERPAPMRDVEPV